MLETGFMCYSILPALSFRHRDLLLQFAESVCNNSQMSSALKADLRQTLLITELQALELFGKYVTGPWMALFYTSASERNHFEMSEYLKCAVGKLERLQDRADEIVMSQTDVFGRPLVVDDTLLHLRISDNLPELSVILSRLIGSFLKVLKRQLVRYLYGELANPTEDLIERASAAPVHNIWAERNLGMYDAQSRRAANASDLFLDSKCKATFNKTLGWLDNASLDRQSRLIRFAVQTVSRNQTTERQRQAELHAEIIQRIRDKAQQKDMTKRRRVEKGVKLALSSRQPFPASLFDDFIPDVGECVYSVMKDPHQLVGKRVTYVWYEHGKDVIYNGRILKVTRKSLDISIGYWKNEEEEEEDASDYKLRWENILTDIALGDLRIIE